MDTPVYQSEQIKIEQLLIEPQIRFCYFRYDQVSAEINVKMANGIRISNNSRIEPSVWKAQNIESILKSQKRYLVVYFPHLIFKKVNSDAPTSPDRFCISQRNSWRHFGERKWGPSRENSKFQNARKLEIFHDLLPHPHFCHFSYLFHGFGALKRKKNTLSKRLSKK